jgi:glycosyltransferase involved in cell wall biosynthesis
MPDPPKFSVIVPVHRENPLLREVRKKVHAASSRLELIIVLNDPSLEAKVKSELPNEKVVSCTRKGRGFAFARGAEEVTGDIVLLLHCDTLLPPGWDASIANALGDRGVVGGGFHLAFDRPTRFLNFLIWISDLQVRLRRSMWGDRAVFARADVFRKCLPALGVPLFEDVRLSKCLRRFGRLALLKDTVVTSAEHFWRNGKCRQTGRILVARTWYSFGGDIGRIYDYYYSR